MSEAAKERIEVEIDVEQAVWSFAIFDKRTMQMDRLIHSIHVMSEMGKEDDRAVETLNWLIEEAQYAWNSFEHFGGQIAMNAFANSFKRGISYAGEDPSSPRPATIENPRNLAA